MKTGFLLIIILAALRCSAQCVDSTQITPSFPCPEEFEPVCGCDAKNYRNQCAAEHWGGIAPQNVTQGVCDNFEFDFVPNPVKVFPAKYSVFVKSPSPVLVQLYDVFGRIKYSINYQTSYDNQKLGPYDFNMDGFQKGIYIFLVTVAGESKGKKILRVSQ